MGSSPADLHAHVDAACDRVESLDASLYAMLPEEGRRARLHADADALLGRWPSPERRPPLFGVLVGVKDVFHVDGLPTRGGSSLPAAELAGPESAAVAALRRAGALVLGKTRTTEFAYAAPGPTRNPLDPARTPGGSSQGSAAGVAAGLFPLALGTQTIASTIRPAAFCGVVGYVPTRGRIDPAGSLFLARTLDRVGLLAADLAGVAVGAAVLVAAWRAQGPARPGSGGPGRPVLGVAEGPYLGCVEPAARELFERQVAALAAAGHQVRRERVFDDAEEVTASLLRLVCGELAREHRRLYERHRDRYRPQTLAAIERGRTIGDRQLEADRAAVARRRERVEAQRRAAGVDLWISPAACGPAPLGLDATGAPWLSVPWSYVGLPALSLPAGTVGGLPVGLQVVGGWDADEALIAWGERLAADVGRLSVPAPGPGAEPPPAAEFAWS